MSEQTLAGSWLAPDVRQAVTDFAAQLRSGVKGSTKVPNLTWTVADLAAHVAGLPGFYKTQHQAGDQFEQPDDFDAFSTNARAHISETGAVALADRLETEFDGFLDEFGPMPIDSPRWLYGERTTVGNLAALFLNELVLHGRDLAGATGATPPSLTRRQGNAIVDAIMITTPRFVDRDKARAQPNGVYQFSLKEGKDYTWTLTDGELTITEGRPKKADARLKADPVIFMMASLGRISDVRAALSGGMISYGRKPWRFIGLGTITADGV